MLKKNNNEKKDIHLNRFDERYINGWSGFVCIKSDGYDQFSSIYDTYKEFDDGLYKQLISLRDKISNFTDLKTHSKEINDVEKKFTLFNGHFIY